MLSLLPVTRCQGLAGDNKEKNMSIIGYKGKQTKDSL